MRSLSTVLLFVLAIAACTRSSDHRDPDEFPSRERLAFPVPFVESEPTPWPPYDPAPEPDPTYDPGPAPTPPPQADLRIAVSCRDVWLRAGETAAVRVFVYRHAGFSGRVEISAVNLPDGVTAETGFAEPGEETATILLRAATDAPDTFRHPARVYAYVPGGTFATEDLPVLVSDEPPAWTTGFSIATPPQESVGGLDGAFGDRGAISADSRFLSMKGVFPDGTVAATFQPEQSGCSGILRIGRDGRRVLPYGDRGAFVLDLPGDTYLTALEVVSDGSAVFAGLSRLGTDDPWMPFIGRATSEGTWDTAFGAGGLLARSERFERIAVYPSGDFLVASGDRNQTLILSRFLADGTLDAAFGEGGTTSTTRPEWHHVEWPSPLIDEEGRILVEVQRTLLLRYDSHGHLDPTFGVGGIVTVGYDYLPVLDDDSRVVLVVWTAYSMPELWRLNADGQRDSSFGAGGRVEFPSGELWRIAMRGSQIFVLGSRGGDPVVTCLREDGNRDLSFSGGQRTYDLGVYAGATSAVVSDGRLFLGGIASVSPDVWHGFMLSIRLE